MPFPQKSSEIFINYKKQLNTIVLVGQNWKHSGNILAEGNNYEKDEYSKRIKYIFVVLEL